MQPQRRCDNLIYAPRLRQRCPGPGRSPTPSCRPVNSLHRFNTARLAELQGLDLGMDYREEQRCK